MLTSAVGPVLYSVTLPVGGDHNAAWMNCGVYDKPVPSGRAVHSLGQRRILTRLA